MAASHGRRQVVLLVDDEPQIVNMLQIMLAGMGYRVRAYTDSQEALRAFGHPASGGTAAAAAPRFGGCRPPSSRA